MSEKNGNEIIYGFIGSTDLKEMLPLASLTVEITEGVRPKIDKGFKT